MRAIGLIFGFLGFCFLGVASESTGSKPKRFLLKREPIGGVKMATNVVLSAKEKARFEKKIKKLKSDEAKAMMRRFIDAPNRFDLTLMTHYSDNDFGFQFLTEILRNYDSMFPMQKISVEKAGNIIIKLDQSGFFKRAKIGKRIERFRATQTKPVKRAYSLLVRDAEKAYFFDTVSIADFKKQYTVIAKALGNKSAFKKFADTHE